MRRVIVISERIQADIRCLLYGDVIPKSDNLITTTPFETRTPIITYAFLIMQGSNVFESFPMMIHRRIMLRMRLERVLDQPQKHRSKRM